MDVFELRDNLVADYSAYVRSFINIRDPHIGETVHAALDGGALWPEALIQINPSFERGECIDELVGSGILSAECSRIFRLNKGTSSSGETLHLHKHQADAVKVAETGANYVLTTGTGSGKSLAYIIPMVDWVLRRGPGKGIQGLVVYPMNALANSQFNELSKFLKGGYPEGQSPVTFARYTGQEATEEKEQIRAHPPDILLTNYVMLELILTRPEEYPLVQAAQGLRFLVLDELHTYRGRQGADVAMLIRRAREAFTATHLQCVGTSATLAGRGTLAEQRKEVARVAAQLFGAPVSPDHVIGETLRRATPERDLSDPAFVAELRKRLEAEAPPSGSGAPAYAEFVQDPLSIWIESTFGVQRESSQEPSHAAPTGALVRQVPMPIGGPDGAAQKLSAATSVSEDRCVQAIRSQLMASYAVKDPETGFPVFAFRLHQFISRGDRVYASLEPESKRHLTLQGQRFVPGDRTRALLPLAFCRECGQEFYVVRRSEDPQIGVTYIPRELRDRENNDGEPGFLYLSSEKPWPNDPAAAAELLPEDWVEEFHGAVRVRSSHQKHCPRLVRVDGLGHESTDGVQCAFFPAPFHFCPRCGVTYSTRKKSDFGQLASLATEGRSTATTVLSLATILHLRDSGLDKKARKLLSFTDNRQDAALQAGHFNDFVEVAVLRSALFRAVQAAGNAGLKYDVLLQRVFQALALPLEDYAVDPGVLFAGREETDRALREVLGYRLYRDQERGWRVTLPNLEQCGLLEIRYDSLDEVCSYGPAWQGRHSALAEASPEVRQRIAKTLLDYMRRELAIKVDYLRSDYQERICAMSAQKLIYPWAIDEGEALESARTVYPRSCRGTRDNGAPYGRACYLSPRGGFGQYLRRELRQSYPNKFNLRDLQQITADLFGALKKGGLAEEVVQAKDGDDVPGYQIPASAMIWVAGDGSRSFRDPIRVPRPSETGGQANPFFVEFYRSVGEKTRGFEAREHTAQVNAQERQDREERFRQGELPVLYCSPTMELGVDISELNAVNMRNIPPTPANYAQRSGRAGRSGRPALVFSYCSTYSSHDQYFFRRPKLMVAGAVTPPRLDLANEDLVRAHVHAIWLAETRVDLKHSLRDVLEAEGDEPSLALCPSVQAGLRDPQARIRAAERARRVLHDLVPELQRADWYTDDWLDHVLAQAEHAFEVACQRWRTLYRSALAQSKRQQQIILDASRDAKDKDQAKRLRHDAESQLDLLLAKETETYDSDFYSYRYFASEGFLPGYSFPRLPLSAYIPGRRGKKGRDEYLSRPRFLAISEFAPRAIVYHEGSRYRIHRVILPPDERREPNGEGPATTAAKLCGACGYLHLASGGNGPDVCEICGQPLPQPLAPLFRLENVSARRVQRISADEEERMRQGYEIYTGLRFAEREGRAPRRTGRILEGTASADPWGLLTYGDAATLWRINLGPARRSNRGQRGFVLDLERGTWATEGADDAEENEIEESLSPRTCRVIPYVEDRKNCLLLQPTVSLGTEAMASLEAALRRAMDAFYQLEESELAVEPLPSKEDRRLILFYEAAEGGAGVLRRLLDDPGALAEVAREALRICHFDPETGEDLDHAAGSPERCETACYDCLMSYSNQPDHRLLDRHLIRAQLLCLAQSRVEASPTTASRQEHLAGLERQCQSQLERRWLHYLNDHGLRLPARAQVLIEQCHTRPDFFYDEEAAAIYVDGPPHEYPDRQERDRRQTECMEDGGYQVIRFASEDDWDKIMSRYPTLFGRPS